MSTLVQAEIVNVFVLVVILARDLGRQRAVGVVRIVAPLVVSAAIVPLFLHTVATQGSGLALELAGVAVGIGVGFVALWQLRVYRSGETGKPVSAAGWGYAVVWIVVIGARAVFSYGASHWFTVQLGQWLLANHISVAALTDALLFMAIAMLLTRTVGLAIRASRAAQVTASEPAQVG